MTLRQYFLVFVAAFAGSFFLASCLNEDNKIPPNCYDGILNNDEELVDCGGPCEPCNHCINGVWEPNLGETCIDCGGECGACPQCRNCIQDGDESGIDCGGTFCGPCENLCDDGILNGNEEQIDCGGDCGPCPTCTDLTMNGDEIGIDCGGTQCPPCSTDGNCVNLILDGDEYWVDCGGSTCPPCQNAMTWRANGITHVVEADNIEYQTDGTSFTITGTSTLGATLVITSTIPTGGFVEGTSVTMNQASVPGRQMSYTSELGGVFSSGTSAAAAATMTTNRYFTQVDPPAFVHRAAFSGTLYDAGGTVITNITNGSFLYTF
ncbi:MAG: hypothetical protein ACK5XV_06900 [Flavobacteriales bacterium]|jgi:hypothetical protein